MQKIFPLAIFVSFLFCVYSDSQGVVKFGELELLMLQTVFMHQHPFSIMSVLLVTVLAGQLALIAAIIFRNGKKSARFTYTGIILLNSIAIYAFAVSLHTTFLTYIPLFVLSIAYIVWKKFKKI